MKKNLLYIILVSYSTYSLCAESSLTTSWIKQPLTNFYRRVINRLQDRKLGAKVVASDMDDDAVLVSFVDSGTTEELHKKLMAVNKEMALFGEILEEKSAKSQYDKKSFESSLASMQGAVSKKDSTISTLQQKIALLERELNTTQEGFEKLEESTSHEQAEEYSTDQIMREYHAALRAKESLEQELESLKKAHAELRTQITQFSKDFDRSIRANQLLQDKISQAYALMEEEDKAHLHILEQQNSELLTIKTERAIALDQKDSLLQTLAAFLQQGAHSQGIEYTKDFVREFLSIIPTVSGTTKEKILMLLFPSTISANTFES